MGRPAKNIIGQNFGRWLVLQRDISAPTGTSMHAKWICKCECGVERSVFSTLLISGRSYSCGCFAREDVARRNTKHGRYGTPMYETWNSMIDRCINQNHRAWKWYGARGIKVCERWQHSFQNFLADMGERPKGLTLDRINNNGNYEPSNCRWATWSQQNKNRRPRSEWQFNKIRKAA